MNYLVLFFTSKLFHKFVLLYTFYRSDTSIYNSSLVSVSDLSCLFVSLLVLFILIHLIDIFCFQISKSSSLYKKELSDNFITKNNLYTYTLCVIFADKAGICINETERYRSLENKEHWDNLIQKYLIQRILKIFKYNVQAPPVDIDDFHYVVQVLKRKIYNSEFVYNIISSLLPMNFQLLQLRFRYLSVSIPYLRFSRNSPWCVNASIFVKHKYLWSHWFSD